MRLILCITVAYGLLHIADIALAFKNFDTCEIIAKSMLVQGVSGFILWSIISPMWLLQCLKVDSERHAGFAITVIFITTRVVLYIILPILLFDSKYEDTKQTCITYYLEYAIWRIIIDAIALIVFFVYLHFTIGPGLCGIQGRKIDKNRQSTSALINDVKDNQAIAIDFLPQSPNLLNITEDIYK